jgi:glycosyltransferase involved in cell wall biosynthesis
MKILLSAYACEPEKGSEPGLGWEWVVRLSKRHDLWVVTRSNNRSAIEAAKPLLPGNIHFVYVDIPRSLSFWKRGNRGVNLYYFLWQIAAWRKCRSLIREHRIDLAHHVTLMSATRFSFVPLLGIPSVIGPVGGLQTCPASGHAAIRHRFREFLRNFSIGTLRWNPLFLATNARATRLVLATQSGCEALPASVLQEKVRYLQIGSNPPPSSNSPVKDESSRPLGILWSGRLEDHKGLEILIRSLAYLRNEESPFEKPIKVFVTGSGPEKNYFQYLCRTFGVDEVFSFLGWMDRDEYEALWNEVDIFAFTSLRETTGVALQEAMWRRKPCIVLANGGPGEMITADSGIPVNEATYEALIVSFANAIKKLGEDSSLRTSLGNNAKRRAEKHYDWEVVAENMERIYAEAVS